MSYTTLAIDTSCDETSASVVRGFTVFSNVLPSQMEFHQKYGGIMPSLARLAHQERIDNVVTEAMKKAKVEFKDIDAIAVTIGPGLAIALEVGIKKAKELAEEYGKPLITVNHMEGHLLSAFAERSPKFKASSSKQLVTGNEYRVPGNKNKIKNLYDKKLETRNPKPETKQNVLEFPSLGFLISGKHTELLLIKAIGDYELVGETVDDACGEAFDKCGRILGFGYPGGPVIGKFAKEHRKNMSLTVVRKDRGVLAVSKNKKSGVIYELPVSMAYSGDLNFSFSGLKTAFKNLTEKVAGAPISYNDQLQGEVHNLTKEQIMDLCVAFEHAALTQLAIKLKKAIEMYEPKEVWLGGGVVASGRLRSVLRAVGKETSPRPSPGRRGRERGVETFRYPTSRKLTTDNAAMIGVAANARLMKLKDLKHDPENGVYMKEFEIVDREPNLSF